MDVSNTPHNKLLEKDIERMILDYLGYFNNSLICKIEISGKPKKINGRVILIPFKSKFHRKGMSDVLFWHHGKSWAFEIKSKKEWDWYQRQKMWLQQTPLKLITDKKKKHFKEQQMFIEEHRAAGGCGDFVYDVNQVKDLIKNFLDGKKNSL